MMRILCIGLVLALLLAACGDKDPEAEKLISSIENSGAKQVCFGKVTAIVTRMVANVDTFGAATDAAPGGEQFAAAIQTLMAGTKAGWADLQLLNDDLNKVGATKAEVATILEEPLAKANERRDAAMERGCEKWADADAVQLALRAWVEYQEAQ